MSKNLPKISDAEFEIMKVVWDKAPISTNDVIDSFKNNDKWSSRTIQTMLIRLDKKGVLAHEKKGRTYEYYPLVERNEYIELEKNKFLNKFFGGAFNNLFVNYLENENVSEIEIYQLRKILDEKIKKED